MPCLINECACFVFGERFSLQYRHTKNADAWIHTLAGRAVRDPVFLRLPEDTAQRPISDDDASMLSGPFEPRHSQSNSLLTS